MRASKKMVAATLAVLMLGAFAGCQSSSTGSGENPAVNTLTTTAYKDTQADQAQDSNTSTEENKDTQSSQAQDSAASTEVVSMDQFPAGTDEGTELGYQLEEPEEGEEIAVMTTSMGEIRIRLFPEAAPKTVYNFKKLAETGYYDGLTFHRVINDFMIQGGDPSGDGTGGESIWGEAFSDEFSKNLVNLRGSLAMANSGSNTNGSQFFINQAKTVDSSLWDSMATNYEQIKGMSDEDKQSVQSYYGYTFLNTDLITDAYKKLYEENGGNPTLDGAYNAFDPQRGHTVFGQVFEGMDVVDAIAAVDTNDSDKPTTDVIIEKVEIVPYSK